MTARLFTAAQLQAQAASANASLQSATQSLNAASSGIQNAASTTLSSFTTCLSPYNVFPYLTLPLGAAACSTSAVSNVFNSIASTVQAQIQSATQVFSQALGLSANSAIQAATPLITQTTQLLQQTVQTATVQANSIANQATSCLQQVVATATATNATTASG